MAIETAAGLLLLDAEQEGDVAIAGVGFSADVVRTAFGAIGVREGGVEAAVVWPARTEFFEGRVELDGTSAVVGEALPAALTAVDPGKTVGDVAWVLEALGQDAAGVPVFYIFS